MTRRAHHNYHAPNLYILVGRNRKRLDCEWRGKGHLCGKTDLALPENNCSSLKSIFTSVDFGQNNNINQNRGGRMEVLLCQLKQTDLCI